MAKAQANRHRVQKRKQKIRILLVDDHPGIIEGVSSYLRVRGQHTICGTASSGEQATRKIRSLQPDVVILDLSLPDVSGMDLISVIRNESPRSRIVIYTMHDNKEFLREALNSGVQGFVLKGSPVRTLLRSIESVESGKRYVDKKFKSSGISFELRNGNEGLKTNRQTAESSDHLPLTKREKQILCSLADGLKLQQIADKHLISFHTVVSHLRNIYEKLGAHNRSTAVSIARDQHLL